MTRYIAVLLTAAALLSAIPRTAQAAGGRLPSTLYPRGAHITYRPSLSNADMDCLWNFDCDGMIPLFHFAAQEDLHRVAGWAEFAGVQAHRRTGMVFELFASTYQAGSAGEGGSWSENAFSDILLASLVHGYAVVSSGAPLLADPRLGGAEALTLPGTPSDLTVMACWSGVAEVEAIVMYDSRSAHARQTALRDLRNQVMTALSLTLSAAPRQLGAPQEPKASSY
jgi:hypothetical protein